MEGKPARKGKIYGGEKMLRKDSLEKPESLILSPAGRDRPEKQGRVVGPPRSHGEHYSGGTGKSLPEQGEAEQKRSVRQDHTGPLPAQEKKKKPKRAQRETMRGKRGEQKREHFGNYV